MSDIRRLLESLDSIAEAGPKGIRDPYQELEGGKGFGGGGGGGGGASVWRSGRTGEPMQIPVTPSAAKAPSTAGKGLPKVERLPGETPAQAIARVQSAQAARPLPQGVTPSTAGAGRGGPLGPISAGEPKGPLGQREKSSILRVNPERGLGRTKVPTDAEIKAAEKTIAQTKLKGQPEKIKKLISPAMIPAATIDLDAGGGGGGGGKGKEQPTAGTTSTSTQGAKAAVDSSPTVSDVEIWKPDGSDQPSTKDADISVATTANAAPSTSAVASKPAPAASAATKPAPAASAATKPAPAASAATKPASAASTPTTRPVAIIPREPTPDELSRIYPTQPQTAVPQAQPSVGTPADRSGGISTGDAASQSQIDALGRRQGSGIAGTIGGTGTGGGQGTGVGAGQGPGRGPGTGTGSGTGSGSGQGSGAGAGTGPGAGNYPQGYDPYQMFKHRTGRTDENRKVNKLIKEFKNFVDRIK